MNAKFFSSSAVALALAALCFSGCAKDEQKQTNPGASDASASAPVVPAPPMPGPTDAPAPVVSTDKTTTVDATAKVEIKAIATPIVSDVDGGEKINVAPSTSPDASIASLMNASDAGSSYDAGVVGDVGNTKLVMPTPDAGVMIVKPSIADAGMLVFPIASQQSISCKIAVFKPTADIFALKKSDVLGEHKTCVSTGDKENGVVQVAFLHKDILAKIRIDLEKQSGKDAVAAASIDLQKTTKDSTVSLARTYRLDGATSEAFGSANDDSVQYKMGCKIVPACK